MGQHKYPWNTTRVKMVKWRDNSLSIAHASFKFWLCFCISLGNATPIDKCHNFLFVDSVSESMPMAINDNELGGVKDKKKDLKTGAIVEP